MTDRDQDRRAQTPARRTSPLVATRYDEGATDGERGVAIIDGSGGMVCLSDADLPRMIALLTCHIAGEDVSFFAQETVGPWWDSDDLDEALADVEQRLATFFARRAAIAARIHAIEHNTDGGEAPAVVEVVSLVDLLRPELAASFTPACEHNAHESDAC